jgi:hypothetical protein
MHNHTNEPGRESNHEIFARVKKEMDEPQGNCIWNFLDIRVAEKPNSFCFRLLPALICPHLDPKIAVFGIANLASAAEINFTTGDLCLRNPNAIALGRLSP